jgi:hypothetical protein
MRQNVNAPQFTSKNREVPKKSFANHSTRCIFIRFRSIYSWKHIENYKIWELFSSFDSGSCDVTKPSEVVTSRSWETIKWVTSFPFFRTVIYVRLIGAEESRKILTSQSWSLFLHRPRHTVSFKQKWPIRYSLGSTYYGSSYKCLTVESVIPRTTIDFFTKKEKVGTLGS